jgi:hypothetical protein
MIAIIKNALIVIAILKELSKINAQAFIAKSVKNNLVYMIFSTKYFSKFLLIILLTFSLNSCVFFNKKSDTLSPKVSSEFIKGSLDIPVAKGLEIISDEETFFGFKDVILNIFIFFGIESTNVYLYISWVVFLLITMVILPSSNGLIT